MDKDAIRKQLRFVLEKTDFDFGKECKVYKGKVRDNYTVGYTLAYTVGVWVGNNDNSPMNPYLASGVDGAAPIWNKTMHILLDGREAENFPVPSGIFTKTDNKCGRSEVFTRGSQVPNLCPEPDKDKEKNEAKHKDKD